MASLVAPLAFPLGGTSVSRTAVDVWAQNQLELDFNVNVKNDSILTNTATYTITPLGDGVPCRVLAVRPDNVINPIKLYLTVSSFTVGVTYLVSMTSINRINGDAITPDPAKFIGRLTKQDSMIQARPGLYDISPDALHRNVLAAIGKQDDLIGGYRNDRFGL